MTRVLMVISAADSLTFADGTQHPTGFWAEEVAASHEYLAQAGIEVDLASPGGRQPTVDPLSLDSKGGVEPGEAERFRTYLTGLETQLAAPLPLADVDLAGYDAIYIPGGHAPMTDLVVDQDLGRLLSEAVDSAKPVAALCHGVAALLSAGDEKDWFYKGRRMTGFTDAEEVQGGYGENIPFSVEESLRDRGAQLEVGAPWSDTVVVAGTLVTGQNPQSSVSTAKALIRVLSAA